MCKLPNNFPIPSGFGNIKKQTINAKLNKKIK